MKKLSKRLLSVLLAALLVMTSVPMFAFNAAAADTSALDEAMTAYEQKMNGNFYTNMKAAYDAYCAAAAVKANADASASDIANAASALSTATENMGEFSGHVANGPVHYGSTDVDPSAERYAGILWADGTGATAYDQSQGGKSESSTAGVTYGGYYWFYYPTNTVLMYDGITTPVMPIMLGTLDKDSNYDIHPRWLRVDGTNFSLTDDWVGYNDNFVWPSTAETRISYSASRPQSIDDAFTMDNTSTVRSFGNYLTYTGEPTDTLTTINGMNFYESHSMDVVVIGTLTSEEKTLSETIPIKVINYKKLHNKLAEVGARYNTALDKVGDYKLEGGLGELLEAIDYATTDPNSFFTTGNNYQACANWIDAAIAKFDTVTVKMDEAAAGSVDNAVSMLGAFEAKMNSGAYYKNVLPAYQAYCKLHATIDAEMYGDGSVDKDDIIAATEELNNAMNGLQVYTKYKATGKVKMAADSSAAGSYNQGMMTNVTTTTWQESSISSQRSNLLVWYSVPATVIALYDGDTEIQIPMMTSFHMNKGYGLPWGDMSQRYLDLWATPNTSGSTTDNTDYQFKNKWMCVHDGNNNYGENNGGNYLKWNASLKADGSVTNGTNFGGYNRATSQESGSGCTPSNGQARNNGGDVYIYENFFNYVGGATGFSNGLKTSAIGLRYRFSSADNTTGNIASGTITGRITVYTINYKTPYDQFTAAWSNIMQQLSTGNFNEGGLATQIAKLDAFTAINVGSATTVANATTVASNLATAGNNLTSGLEGTANSEYWQTLREYIGVKPEEGAEEQYAGYAEFSDRYAMEQNPHDTPKYWTPETWTPYLNSIAAARAVMTALPSNNAYYYLDPAAANTAATNLYNAYQALEVNGIPIKPVYDAYNSIVDLFVDGEGNVKNDLYTAESLAAAYDELAKVTSDFYEGPEDKRVDKSYQNTVNTEAAAFTAAGEALREATFTKAEEYAAYLEAAERGVNDPDAYGSESLMEDVDALKNAVYVTVDLPFFGEIRGIKANADQNVDDAWTAVQTDLNTLMTYHVTVVDVDGNPVDANITGEQNEDGTYNYGTEVTVALKKGEANFKYDYVSKTSNKENSHKVKDVGTLSSYTFTVKGDTTITIGAPTDSKPIKVTYRAVLEGGNTFVIDTDYVASADDIDVNAVKAPSYAFYLLNSKTKGAVQNNEVTVTLNYKLANGLPQYEIYNDATETTETYYFNELVTVDMDDAPAVIIAKSQEDYDAWYEQCDEGTFTDKMVEVAAFGSTYTFRARENLWTVYIDDYDSYKASYKVQKDELGNDSRVYVRSQNTTSGASLVTYNAIALPEGYEIVEAGVIAQYNKSGDNLNVRDKLDFNEVGKDQGNDKVRRLKSYKVHDEEDNRYSITLNLETGAKVRYRAYVNYKDDQGKAHTVMSEVFENITIE